MSKVILIRGARPYVGASVAHAFFLKGYKVALASRSQKESDNSPSEIHIPTDVSNLGAMVAAFAKTRSLLREPSVVVYNVGAQTEDPPEDPPLLKVEAFEKEIGNQYHQRFRNRPTNCSCLQFAPALLSKKVLEKVRRRILFALLLRLTNRTGSSSIMRMSVLLTEDLLGLILIEKLTRSSM
ncbi:hypothetical protein LSUB1_G000484 [Lachnellula subtilissima]|uniref:Uncharacterized protein n=1 Tax=Lachnellula subtilissima TaxID=602034 RepID=A0A8H8S3J7_9HELO|nr:hypothetical protein LSUB1_G000484 [Lachnellula subtilissima]